MDYTLADLEMATRRVVEGEALIRQVHRLIARRIERGQDTALSERLIETMLVTLALMMDHKAEIEAERKHRGLASFTTPVRASARPLDHGPTRKNRQ
jgi:hypothetical protein